MARPVLRTKFRGVGQGQCEVFIELNGSSVSLFKYGVAGASTDAIHSPDYLSAHFGGKIYSIQPEAGIWQHTPPATGALYIHAFTTPATTSSSCIGWKSVLKDNKTQIMTIYKLNTGDFFRMVFIDANGNVTETSTIPGNSPANIMGRSILFGNKLYSAVSSANNQDIMAIDPGSQSISNISWFSGAGGNTGVDICSHSGSIYGFRTYNQTSEGGNQLWKIDSAIPFKLGEWNAYQFNSGFVPQPGHQNCIFSTEDNLYCWGFGSGNASSSEMGLYKMSFDEDGNFNGVIDITANVLGFSSVETVNTSKFWYSRDIESSNGEIIHYLHLALGNTNLEGRTVHTYVFNGPDRLATYKGFSGDAFTYDTFNDKLGGGIYTYTDENELNFAITNTHISGFTIDIGYIIHGVAAPSSVAISPVFNNMNSSPISTASIIPLDNGFVSGEYIAGLTPLTSGNFRWNLLANEINSGDIPNLNVRIIRTS